MKKSVITLSLLVFFTVLFRMPLHAQAIKIGMSDAPPYEYVLGDGTVTGLSTEIIVGVFRKMNSHDFEISLYPWKRALHLLSRGDIHALYTIAKTEEREKQYHFSEEPFYNMKSVFFIRKEDRNRLKFETFDDLKGKRIGLVRGYYYTPGLWKFVRKEQNYEEVSKEEQNIRKLAAGRIDYTFIGYAAGIYHAKRLGVEDEIIALGDKPLQDIPVYIAFSKKVVTKEFVGEFSNKLKEFKTGEKYQEIMKRYFGK